MTTKTLTLINQINRQNQPTEDREEFGTQENPRYQYQIVIENVNTAETQETAHDLLLEYPNRSLLIRITGNNKKEFF